MKTFKDYVDALPKNDYKVSSSGSLYFNRSIGSILKSSTGKKQISALKRLAEVAAKAK